MEYTLREEVIEQLQLILESINIIQERNKEIVTVSDYTSSTWGMTVLDATLMRIQFILSLIHIWLLEEHPEEFRQDPRAFRGLIDVELGTTIPVEVEMCIRDRLWRY